MKKIRALAVITAFAVLTVCGTMTAAALTDGGSTSPDEKELSVIGDLNGDGKLNMVDYGLMRAYLAGKNVTIDLAAADVDNNGEINDGDRVLMQAYMAGADVELK